MIELDLGQSTLAAAIHSGLNGALLNRPPFHLKLPEVAPQLVEGRRIGITLAAETPWRFGLAGSPYLSRAFAVRDSGLVSGSRIGSVRSGGET
jgi:DNA-3-methyladenine glycosylase